MKQLIILAILINIDMIGWSQTDTTQGVFRTSSHFIGDSIPEEDNGLIRNNVLFRPEIVILKGDGGKTVFHKDSIYGYCKENICYRFFDKEEYKIEDTGVVCIYSKTEMITESKLSYKKVGIYFSVGPDGEIRPLSVHEMALALQFSTSELVAFKESFDDKTILIHHASHAHYDVNDYLIKLFRKQP